MAKAIPLDLPGLCVGAFGAVADAQGLHPRRLPEWVLSRLGVPAMSFLSGMPAGVRLEMVTDAPWVELDVQLTLLEVDGETAWPPRALFEAVVDGLVVAGVGAADGNIIKIDRASGEMDFVAGGPVTIRLDGWPSGKCQTRNLASSQRHG